MAIKRNNASSGKPKPPRWDCKLARKWALYYERMADWYQASADILKKDYPESAQMVQHNADRFRDGVKAIRNNTHPNVVSGEWK